MKLIRFRRGDEPAWGIEVDGGVADLTVRLGCRSLPEVLAATAGGRTAPAEARRPDHAMDQVSLLCPVDPPARVFCVGRNYRDHLAEMGAKVPDQPNLFVRLHDSLARPGGEIVRPRVSVQLDYEGELAVVIGRAGRHIPRDRALDHVAGYTCFNDGSIRDVQFNGSLLAGKNFAQSGSCGPWIATADEVGDPHGLTLVTRLNGAEVQHGSTSALIFDVPYIIQYISAFTALYPGDIIATGTPEGVGAGRKPPLWMKAGDRVEVEISKVGLLRNRVVDEA